MTTWKTAFPKIRVDIYKSTVLNSTMKTRTSPSRYVLKSWMETALTNDAMGYLADIRYKNKVWYVRDAEAGDKPGRWRKVTPATMLKGWKIISKPGYDIDYNIKAWARMDIEEDWGGNSDSYSLDAILQAGLFGKVMYG